MSEMEQQALKRLEETVPKLNDFYRGRMIGQAEGLAMAFEAKEQQECIAGKEYQGTF